MIGADFKFNSSKEDSWTVSFFSFNSRNYFSQFVGLETAAFPGQDPQEIERLLHMVVVGGGPTGVELSGELHDFLEDDLKSWYPELASKIRISLVEALPSVLPMFSKQLIEYTESTFKESKIDILTKTMVKEVKEKSVVLQMPDKTIKEVPCGLVVWAAVCSFVFLSLARKLNNYVVG